MSIITRKVCKCGQPYMSVKHSTQCDMCSRGNVKNVVCAYHGMLISFRMLDSVRWERLSRYYTTTARYRLRCCRLTERGNNDLR